MNTDFCPTCSQKWPDKLIMAAQSCPTCDAERERRAALWVGDMPAPTPLQSKQASPSAAPARPQATTPRRSLADLFDDLGDLGIAITLNPDDTLTAKPMPPPAVVAELRARKPLVLLALKTFSEIDTDTMTKDPDYREAMRWGCLADALASAGEEYEARIAHLRYVVALARAEATFQTAKGR